MKRNVFLVYFLLSPSFCLVLESITPSSKLKHTRSERKLSAALAMGAAGGLAAGALVGGILGNQKDDKDILSDLKLDFLLENGFFMHHSVQRGNILQNIQSFSSKTQEELSDFQIDTARIIDEIKAAVTNAAQSQNRHINKAMNSQKS